LSLIVNVTSLSRCLCVMHTVWHVLAALSSAQPISITNVATDVLTFSYSYQHLLTIRIRTVTFSAARFARFRGEHVGHSITQRKHGVKEANEVSGKHYLLYPYGGLIAILYINIGFRNFCQNLQPVERPLSDDNSGVPVQ